MRPPSEVGPPLEVESTLEVPFLWMGRDEETLEGYFDSVVVHMGRVSVRWWVDILGIRSIVGGASICGMRCLRIVSRRLRFSRMVVLRWCGMRPLISSAKVLASVMTQLEGVTAGFL